MSSHWPTPQAIDQAELFNLTNLPFGLTNEELGSGSADCGTIRTTGERAALVRTELRKLWNARRSLPRFVAADLPPSLRNG